MGILILAAFLAGGDQPEPAPPGPPSTFGWRRDGTGVYPDPKPPLEWHRLSRTMLGLKCQAKRPKGADAGAAVSASLGYIPQWLVLGPLEAADETASIATPAVPNETELQPDEGQKSGSAAWTPLPCEDTLLNLMGHFKTMRNVTAYAHTYLHSAGGASLWFQPEHARGLKLWLNGKEIYAKEVTNHAQKTVLKVELAAGWNRLLARLTPVGKGSAENPAECYLRLKVWSAKPGETYEQKNILWTTPMPNRCASNPVIAGHRIFLGSAPFDLVCLDKNTGKPLWIRSNNYADAATEAERKSEPFQKVAPLIKRRDELNQAWVSRILTDKECEEKDGLDHQATKLMGEVDKTKYPMVHEWQDGAFFSGPTPVTDGKFVYAWFAHGVTVCYDLEGNRKWIRCDNKGWQEHGYWGSPVLAGGNVIVWMKEAMAFDAKTGAPAWKVEAQHGNWYSSPVTTRIGGVEAVVLQNGAVIRATDGLVVSPGTGWHWSPSPAVSDGFVHLAMETNHYRFKIPDSLEKPVKTAPIVFPGHWPKELHEPGWPRFLAVYTTPAQLCADGLSYTLNNSGVLTVMNLKEVGENKPSVVYQKRIPSDSWGIYQPYPYTSGICTSPTWAAGNVYLVGNSGMTLVLAAGREGRIVARNKIECTVGTERKSPWNYLFNYWPEHLEGFVSNPVFESSRLFLRGERNLYCIGAK
jgi:outer membrane protein assembly factor BamB